MRLLTWSDFDHHSPCYSPQQQYGYFKGTILDILKDERIPDNDKIWAATRQGILDDKTLRLFACKCVREVWHLLTDERLKNAVEVAERYANGQATDEELDAARYASAAASAASEAAVEAAWSDASAASAASDASDASEKQVSILIEIVEVDL